METLTQTAVDFSFSAEQRAIQEAARGPVALSSTDVVGTYTFSTPPRAAQPSTSILLDTGNSRVRQASGIGDTLSIAQTTACSIGALPNESCVRVARFSVAPGSAQSSHTAAMTAQVTFGGSNGDFYWMPGVAVNSALRTGVPFLNSNASTFLSSSWTLTNDATLAFPAALSLTSGTCAQTFLYPGDTLTRTGDYMGAQVNPNDQTSFWFAGERATKLGGLCQANSEWDTRIVQVTP